MLFLLLPLASAQGAPSAEFLPGDLVFHESKSRQSAMLRAVTGSRYTHVGLVLRGEHGLEVVEAVQPVRRVPLASWVERGVGRHVVVRRPTQPVDASALEAAAARHLGKPYDARFAWDDDKLYCSELVAKVYEEAMGWTIGERRPIASWVVSDGAVLAEMRRRGIDPAEQALAPADLMDDPQFTPVPAP